MTYDDSNDVPAIWQVGDVILGKYEVKQIFTGGGMGLVYRVHHRGWNLDLAAKSPRAAFFETEEQIKSFEREAESWVSLGLHPNVVSCFYVRRLGTIPMIFAEFVDGGSLSDWIRNGKLYEGSGASVARRIIDVAIQFARGLYHAHQMGLIHQDVKPANVLMTSSGIAKVSDFGLARARPRAATAAKKQSTPGQTIVVAGSGFLTPEYASPEQAKGLPLSRKTDVWSWAVSILEVLKGELDWSHGQAAPFVLEDFYGDAFSRDPLARLLAECLEPDPQKRPADFQSIIETLQRIYETTTGEKYPRAAPQVAVQSSDVLNNYAVSLLDLDRLFRVEAGQRGAYDYFLELEGKDRTHVDGMLNMILMRWRHLHTSIHEINRAIDNICAMPGVAEEVGLDWLISFNLETLQTRKAMHTCSRFEANRSELYATVESAHLQLKNNLRAFFYGLKNRFHEVAQSLLSEGADPDDEIASCDSWWIWPRLWRRADPEGREITVSDSSSGFVCWVGNLDDEGRRVSIACVLQVRDGREVFRLNDKANRIHAAGLSEAGTALVVMFIDERNDRGLHGQKFSFHLAIFDMTGNREEKVLPSMEIPVGFIRLTVNNAGTAASVWVKTSEYGTPWYQIEYNYDFSSGKFRCSYDLRKAAPIIYGELICASGDGERLLVARHDTVQLWETSGAYLRTCLLELRLSDVGLVDIRDYLAGFDLDRGFEFSINQWNIFDVLGALRQISPLQRVPYRIARPQDADQIQREHEQVAQWEKQSAIHQQENEMPAAIGALDNCLRLRSVTKGPLLEKRHLLIKNARDIYVSRCWHHRQNDEYWDSDIMAMESEAEGELTLKRFRSIDYQLSAKFGPRASKWGALEICDHDNIAPYGFAALSDEYAVFLLPRVTWNFENSVALLQRNEPWDARIVWELPLQQCGRTQMYDMVVLVGDVLFRKEESGAIVAHDVLSGREKKRLTFDDSVSLMRRVVYRGMTGLAVGTKTTGKLYVFNENAERVAKFSVGAGGKACVDDVSRCVDALVFSDSAGSVWQLWIESGDKTCLWNRWENYQDQVWNLPYFSRISPCGRAVAYVVASYLRVFDVLTSKLVLNWKIPGGDLAPPCFDLSGRWLNLVHSANKREVFELMWDILDTSPRSGEIRA